MSIKSKSERACGKSIGKLKLMEYNEKHFIFESVKCSV